MLDGDGRDAELEHGQMHAAVLIGDYPVAVAGHLPHRRLPRGLHDAGEIPERMAESRRLQHAGVPADGGGVTVRIAVFELPL